MDMVLVFVQTATLVTEPLYFSTLYMVILVALIARAWG